MNFTANITSASADGLEYAFDVLADGTAIASFTSRFINELCQHGRVEGEAVVMDRAGNVLIRMERQFLTETPTVDQRRESMDNALDLFGQDPAVVAFLTSLMG